MKKICFVIGLLIILLIFGCDGNDTELQVKKEMVDGIVHLVKPEKPLNGSITLEIEKIREINPYDTEDFGLRWIDFKRNIDGEVIFFTQTGSEVHRFNPDGKYLGNLIRHGQGPGEFSKGQFLNPFFVNNQLYVTGGQKLAKFEKNGNFINERKTGQYPQIFVDENRFFIRERERRNIDWNVKISLIKMDSKGTENFHETIFFPKRKRRCN